MPQAIKHFNATLTNSSSGTVYTCPADTIAIVIPTITVNQNATNAQTTFSWNSSTAAASFSGNLSFHYYSDSADMAHVSAIDKYNILVTVPDSNNANSKTLFAASYTTSLDTVSIASHMANGLSADYNPITPSGVGKSSSNTPGVHATGPWVMSAGHVLSYYLNGNQSTTYNFLILEEAA
jgi:hypothetical protein